MDDLGFVSLVSFIFENKTTSTKADSEVQEASSMLRLGGHMTLDVDTCRPIHIDTASGDTSVLVSMLNKYQPQFPVTFSIKDLNGMKDISDLAVSAMSRYTYSKGFEGPMTFPSLHGGEVVVNGDVQIQSVIDSINSSPLTSVMTSFIVVNGTVISCDEASCLALVNSIKSRLQMTAKESMFGLLMVAQSDHTLKYYREETVRSWSIKCESSQGRLTFHVSNLLRA